MRRALPVAGAVLLSACQPVAEPPETETTPLEETDSQPSSTFHQALAEMALTPETASAVEWEDFRQEDDRAIFVNVSGEEDGDRWTADKLIIVNPRLDGEQPIFDRWEIAGYQSELGGGAAFDSMSLSGPNSAYAESLTMRLAD